jgi:2-polyprenyl-3-methyl-5-hydroxy-6-metoxy-1,4-benzoquinol methylase
VNQDIIDINKRQTDFYNNKKKNLVTRVWFYFRNGTLNQVRKNLGIEKQIQQLHIRWSGDLSNKKVLDLGCYEGNAMSIYLAKNSKEYLAIDLSEIGIAHLSKRLEHINNASAKAIDFLSEEFKEDNFDLIYAYGVLHHFKDVDKLIVRLKEKLTPNGAIISNDPLQTSLPIKIVRSIYRPFQSDKDWEWPFSKRTYFTFNNSFKIIEKRGMLGKAKWAFLLNFLPISQQKKNIKAKKWHLQDWENSNNSNQVMFSCMHLTMLMQNK